MNLHNKKLKKKKSITIKFSKDEKFWNIDCYAVLLETIFKNFKYRRFTLGDLQDLVDFVSFDHSKNFHVEKLKEKKYLEECSPFEWHYQIDTYKAQNMRTFRLNKQIKYYNIETLKKEIFFLKLQNKG